MVRAVMVRLPPQGTHGEEALAEGHGAEEAAAQPPRHDECGITPGRAGGRVQYDQTARLWMEKKNPFRTTRGRPVELRRRLSLHEKAPLNEGMFGGAHILAFVYNVEGL